MFRAILLASTFAATAAGAATVDSAANSSSGGTGLATGVFLTAGQNFMVSAAVNDTWSLGQNDPGCTRESNAGGLTACFGNHSQGNLSALFGTLVGQIGTGDFFVIGLSFNGPAASSGQLFLYNWDSNFEDNSGEIEARIAVGAIPLPASGLLLAGALAGAAALRRRQAA